MPKRSVADVANSVAAAAFRAHYDPLNDAASLERIGFEVRQQASRLAQRTYPDLPPDPQARDAAVRQGARARRQSTLILIPLVFGWPVILGAAPLLGAPSDQLSSYIPGVLVVGLLILLARTIKDPPPIPGPRPDPRAAALYKRIEAETMARAAALVTDARRRSRSQDTAERAEVVNERWNPRGPKPVPRATITPAQAEVLAGEWIAFLGAERVRVSQATRDGGVDVRAVGFVAQVKLQTAPVSPASVQQIFGIAQHERCTALFFAGPSGYSAASVDFARTAGVALFIYDAASASLRGASPRADRALSHGLPSI